jgi:hypothetical protein
MYPGYTECDETLVLKETPFATISTDPVFKRKIILLATAAITDNNIFANGLFQNVFVLYKMFESMGMCPMLIVNEKPKTLDNIPPMIRTARMIVAEELLKQPIPVFASEFASRCRCSSLSTSRRETLRRAEDGHQNG